MRQNIKATELLRVGENHNRSEKISFLSHITHGIRTPLNAIMGFSKLLTLKGNTQNNQKKYIKEIIKGSNLLLQFVDNVVDLSLLENNKYSLNIDKFNIGQLIWEFVEGFYDKKNEDKITDINLILVWESDVKDVVIRSDAYLVKKCVQLLFNIITTRFQSKNFELGYSFLNKDSIKIFIRPSKNSTESNDIEKSYYIYEVDKENSFELFNHQVLSRSINMLNGELNLFSDENEYSFTIPVNLAYIK